MKKELNIYCDMDGVLANFNAETDAVKRFATEKGFFKRLKPIRSNVKAIKELIADGYNVYILSASPNKQADIDKIAWLKRHIPQIADGHIILMRNGENKADYVKTFKNNVLIDDYNKNCFDFVNRGYEARQIAPYHTIRRALNIED